MTALCFLLIVGTCFSFCNGANVLIFSGYGEGSHFTSIAHLGLELTHRGHNVTLLISSAYGYRANESRYENMNFEIFPQNVPDEEVRARFDRLTESVFKGSWFKDFMANLSAVMDEFRDDCQALFEDDALLKRLRDAEFDVALVDPIWPCSMIVAEYAAKRFVITMSAAYVPNIAVPAGNPSDLATIPEMNTGFPNRMTFSQRVVNVLYGLLSFYLKYAANIFTPIMRAHDICPGRELSDLYSRAQLVIVNVDFAMEFPIPLQPNFIPVGGLTTAPAKDLPRVSHTHVQSGPEHNVYYF